MAIQPIDLQVLFSRLDQLGKEQAVQKDVPVHNQALQGAEIAKRSEIEDQTVNLTQEVSGEGLTKVKDQKKRRRRPSHQDEKESRKPEEADKPREEVVQDPALGKNIDLMG